MKIKMIITVLLLSFLSVNAQRMKQKSVMVLKNGTVLNGYIRISQNFIHYNPVRKGAGEKYNYETVESVTLRIKDRNKIYRDLKLVYKLEEGKTKPSFFEVIYDKVGKTNIYRKTTYGYLTSKKKKNPETTYYLDSEQGKTVFRFKQKFTKEAKKYFADCGELVDLIGTRHYRRKDLVDIVFYYKDNCFTKETIVETKPIIKKPKRTESKKNTNVVEEVKEPVVKETKIIKPTIEEIKIEKDKVIVNIKPIYFTLDKAEIREDALVELDKVVDIMKRYPTLRIEVGSHTDSRGSDAYNVNLSTKRALATIDYIVKNGANANNIKAIGYGESQLKNNCKNKVKCTELEHQINRRTEFVILNPKVLGY